MRNKEAPRDEKKPLPKKLAISNTKQEMMEAYQAAMKLLEEQK